MNVRRSPRDGRDDAARRPSTCAGRLIRRIEPAGEFHVRLTTRGGADRIEGVGPNAELLARVAAAPVEGAANRALLRLIANDLGVASSAVVLEAGQRGRRKRVRVCGVAPETIRAHWPGLTVS